MLTRREILEEVCVRSSVPTVRFEAGQVNRDELRWIVMAAQCLSVDELEVFDDLLREICAGTDPSI